MHVSIFRTPACVQVIIQENVELHRSADAFDDFYDVHERGTPYQAFLPEREVIDIA